MSVIPAVKSSQYAPALTIGPIAYPTIAPATIPTGKLILTTLSRLQAQEWLFTNEPYWAEGENDGDR